YRPAGVPGRDGDLLRVELLVAGTERAGARVIPRQRVGSPGQEVAAPLGCHDHPAAEDGIAAQLGHRIDQPGTTPPTPGGSGVERQKRSIIRCPTPAPANGAAGVLVCRTPTSPR